MLESVSHHLHILSQFFERVLIPEVLDTLQINVSQTQLKFLRFLKNHPGASPSEISRAFAISAPSVTTGLQRLKNKSLICKAASETDKRSIILKLSQKGKDIVNKAEEAEKDMMINLMMKMKKNEVRALQFGLKSFLNQTAKDLKSEKICLQCGKAHTNECILSQYQLKEE